MISVVIPAHNEAASISRAIGSVAAEVDAGRAEVVVALDRCTDGTRSVVESFGDARIRAIDNEGPPGLAGAINTGMAAAKHPWVARLDADDIQAPDRFSIQLEVAERHALDVCCGWAQLVDNAGTVLMQQTTPTENAGIRRGLVRSNVIVHSSVLMRRLRVLGYGAYRVTRWEDYDLWVRLSAAGFRFGGVAQVVVTRELREAGYGETHGKSFAGRLEVLRHRWRAAKALRAR